MSLIHRIVHEHCNGNGAQVQIYTNSNGAPLLEQSSMDPLYRNIKYILPVHTTTASTTVDRWKRRIQHRHMMKSVLGRFCTCIDSFFSHAGEFSVIIFSARTGGSATSDTSAVRRCASCTTSTICSDSGVRVKK
jgi:hypothetical protein